MQSDDKDPQAPRRLVAAIKQIQPQRVFVPPSVDDTVLRAARRHLASYEKAGLLGFRRWWLWPAFATACVLLLALAHLAIKQAARPGFAREDLNHDGRVDILDAFQLAREMHSGAKAGAGLDLNGDGVVDQRDAEVIAAQAVKLEKGGRS